MSNIQNSKASIASPALPTPSSLAAAASPKTLTSPLSAYNPLTRTKTSSSSSERKSTTASPRTPGPSPFGTYSPLGNRPTTLSRTQTQTTGGIFTPRAPTTANQSPTRDPVDETARTNALWAEMRATLAEVELSATQGGSADQQEAHFFGPRHAKALEELRTAQISLAQAWARADGDGGGSGGDDIANEQGGGRNDSVGNSVSPGGSVLDREIGGLDDKVRNRSGSTASAGSASLDASSQAAERDIATARLRREANDRYFYRVSKGVMNVVSKLEDVATAMGKVEKESRSVWSDEEDSEVESGSVRKAGQTDQTDDKKSSEKDSK